MNRPLAHFGAVLLAVALIMLLTATSGVSSVAVDRPIDIQVVDDENALVGIEETHPTVANDTTDTVALLSISNGLESPATVTAHVESESAVVNNSTTQHSFDPGETVSVTAPVTCSSSGSVDLTVRLTVDSTGVTVERTVETVVTCE